MSRDAGVRFSSIAGDQLAISYFVVHTSAECPSSAAQAFMDLAVSELRRNTSRWESAAPGRIRRYRAADGIRLKDKRIDWNSAARAQGLA
jgi:hypothetical protein